MFLSLYSDNLIMLKFRDVWEKDCCVCSCERRKKQIICVKMLSHHFSLHIFLPIWEEKKKWAWEEKFSPMFSISPIFLLQPNSEKQHFSPYFPLPIFTLTKYTLSDGSPSWSSSAFRILSINFAPPIQVCKQFNFVLLSHEGHHFLVRGKSIQEP